MRKIFIVLSIVIILLSCKEKTPIDKKNQSLNHILKINKIPRNDIIFDDFIKEYKYINLQTTEESLIGIIHKIRFTEKYIFILDNESSKSIFQFDKKGRFLRRIGGQGKGPGEYMLPQDIIVDDKLKIVTIYCSINKKFLNYDFNGNFKGGVDINLKLRNIEIVTGDTLIASAQELYNPIKSLDNKSFNLILLNKRGEILGTQFSNSATLGKGTTIATFNKYFSKNNGSIYYNSILNDTIYEFNGNVIAEPFFNLDFGSKKIPFDVLKNVSVGEILKKIQIGNYWAIIRPTVISNNNIFIAFAAGIDPENTEDYYKLVYNIKSKESIIFHNIIDNEDNVLPIFPVDASNDQFISLITRENFFLIKDEKLQEELSNRENTPSNPVLLLYNLKL